MNAPPLLTPCTARNHIYGHGQACVCVCVQGGILHMPTLLIFTQPYTTVSVSRGGRSSEDQSSVITPQIKWKLWSVNLLCATVHAFMAGLSFGACGGAWPSDNTGCIPENMTITIYRLRSVRGCVCVRVCACVRALVVAVAYPHSVCVCVCVCVCAELDGGRRQRVRAAPARQRQACALRPCDGVVLRPLRHFPPLPRRVLLSQISHFFRAALLGAD